MERTLNASGGDLGFIQLLIAIGISYLGGVLTSFTPCVYPMIPITVSVIGGTGHRSAGGHGGPGKRITKDVLLRIAVYVGGLSIVYTFLGVLAGLSGEVFGSFTNTAGWYITIAIVMMLAALMMMDVIVFDPQAWISAWKARRGKHSASAPSDTTTLLGVFSMGLGSGFIAAPCTTPIFAVLLAFVAQKGNVGISVALMLAFSLGLSTLLIAVGLFAGFLQVLPRSGNWMKWIKLVSGFILLGFGNYLFFKAGAL